MGRRGGATRRTNTDTEDIHHNIQLVLNHICSEADVARVVCRYMSERCLETGLSRLRGQQKETVSLMKSLKRIGEILRGLRDGEASSRKRHSEEAIRDEAKTLEKTVESNACEV